MRRLTFACLLLVAGVASAAMLPQPLRLATIAPEGSAWARMLKDFGEDLQQGTDHRVRLKVTMGGVAGDEAALLDRMLRGDFDGLVGAAICQRVAPSLRALEVAGYVEDERQAQAVLNALRPLAERELAGTQASFVLLTTGFGHRVLFSRDPVRSLDELKRIKLGIYEYDQVERAQLVAMGMHVAPLRLEDVAAALDAHRIDGFISIPAAAVAFRYWTHTRYFTDLHSGYLPGCVMVTNSALARLGPANDAVLRRAGQELGRRFAAESPTIDAQLLATVFPQKGLKPVPMSPTFRREWRESAQRASHALVPRVVSRAALERAQNPTDAR
jgi:TRAP-type transport system periplasmic protein